MTDLEKKINKVKELQASLKSKHQDVMMVNGQLGDILEDIAVNELGLPKNEEKRYDLADILSNMWLKLSIK